MDTEWHIITEIQNLPPPDLDPTGSSDPHGSTVPSKYVDKIKALIMEYNQEFNQHIFIQVRQQGKNSSEIFPMSERAHKYKISMNDAPYTKLNGVYLSVEEIKNKIQDLLAEECITLGMKVIKSNHRCIWKCQHCAAFAKRRGDYILYNYAVNGDDSVYCVNCGKEPAFQKFLWHQFELNMEIGAITIIGGSVSHRHGTLTIFS